MCALAFLGTSRGLTSVSLIVPEARGDSRLLTLSIFLGQGEGGERRGGIQELRHPRPDVRCIYMANGPRVRLRYMHLTYYTMTRRGEGSWFVRLCASSS